MDKKNILSELRKCQVGSIELGDYSAFTDNGLEQFAEAIAQAHEQELSEMEHRYQQANRMDSDIAGMAVRDMKKAQAQVAVMAEAVGYTLVRLKPLVELIPPPKTPTEWVEKLEAALQSAPKVLYAGEAVLLQYRDGSQSLMFPQDKMFGAFTAADEHEYQYPDPDGLRAAPLTRVIVLEGSSALQEQSKAQGPDDECSVNDGCRSKGEQGQNSEQEE